MLKRYFWNLLVAVDQLANTVAGGDPDETLSSRLGKRRRNCRLCYWLCRLLDRISPRHCERSIEPDEGKDAL